MGAVKSTSSSSKVLVVEQLVQAIAMSVATFGAMTKERTWSIPV
jgi:hypothetical protein